MNKVSIADFFMVFYFLFFILQLSFNRQQVAYKARFNNLQMRKGALVIYVKGKDLVKILFRFFHLLSSQSQMSETPHRAEMDFVSKAEVLIKNEQVGKRYGKVVNFNVIVFMRGAKFYQTVEN